MLIYNITLKVEWSVHPQWLFWMQEVYIQQVMQSGCFTKHQLVRLLEIDEDEGPTYALQLYAGSWEAYNIYLENFLLQNEALGYETWGGSLLSFATLMEVIE